MVSSTLSDSAGVFIYPKEDIHHSPPLRGVQKGLHVIYYKNPKKSFGFSQFCFFEYIAKHSRFAMTLIEVFVECDFIKSPPGFTVKKVNSPWVKCADLLLSAEFKKTPLITTSLSEAHVTETSVNFPLPFVEGENPQLQIQCESHKATIVFDFGPDNKKSTTIDFLDWTTKFSPSVPMIVQNPQITVSEEEVRKALADIEKVYANIRMHANKK